MDRTNNKRRDRRMARAAKYADRIGRLYRVTDPRSAYAGRVGIVDDVAPDTLTHVLRMKARTGSTRVAFAESALYPFDPIGGQR